VGSITPEPHIRFCTEQEALLRGIRDRVGFGIRFAIDQAARPRERETRANTSAMPKVEMEQLAHSLVFPSSRFLVLAPPAFMLSRSIPIEIASGLTESAGSAEIPRA
jgi:hypothetical protein